MKSENIKNLKKLRLEYKWSQTQLSELSGLSLRTIQRIENGENPSTESLKALSSLFELDFYISNNPEQLKEQENYYKKVKSFLFKLGLFIIVQIIMIVDALEEPMSWGTFFVVLLYCLYFLYDAANRTFNLSDKIKKVIVYNKYRY
ncbi:helix-turn-helix transcriptional regulator [uncultured Tenacibaculum sp.]|uniref:helix-turn-helix domain-containing protein n=1 Tax=uncultured Tenacibaculum sp. TaxID=174713 RepID=UPI002631A2B5|nr:helix-turn-helix transcriptional regulator [uncultured Tenacibaculum sp.]